MGLELDEVLGDSEIKLGSGNGTDVAKGRAWFGGTKATENDFAVEGAGSGC